MERKRRREENCPTCRFSAVCLAQGDLPAIVLDSLAKCHSCKTSWYFGMDPVFNVPANAVGRFMQRFHLEFILSCTDRPTHYWNMIDECPACARMPTPGYPDKLTFNWKKAREPKRIHFVVYTVPDDKGRYAIAEVAKVS